MASIGRLVSLEEKQAWMREQQAGLSPTAGTTIELHYSVAQVAEGWNLSPDAVRKIFENEPGVLVLNGNRPHTRRYRTLRIPASVVERVHKRFSNV